MYCQFYTIYRACVIYIILNVTYILDVTCGPWVSCCTSYSADIHLSQVSKKQDTATYEGAFFSVLRFATY